ncbi:MAG: hypothetical protein COB90_02190 [Hyphomicrobiales bacterium]|nr:MAG: hypothetical protein COB90_02190 [Hyphomicrobiales bacterium]
MLNLQIDWISYLQLPKYKLIESNFETLFRTKVITRLAYSRLCCSLFNLTNVNCMQNGVWSRSE